MVCKQIFITFINNLRDDTFECYLVKEYMCIIYEVIDFVINEILWVKTDDVLIEKSLILFPFIDLNCTLLPGVFILI